jgi:hypothetical protein
MKWVFLFLTYCAEEHEDELNDVCVGHRVETPQQGVGDGYGSRDPDAHCVGYIQNNAHDSTWECKRTQIGSRSGRGKSFNGNVS